MENEFKQLMALIAKPGTHRQSYACSIAFCAANEYAKRHHEEFCKAYGTQGHRLMVEFWENMPKGEE